MNALNRDGPGSGDLAAWLDPDIHGSYIFALVLATLYLSILAFLARPLNPKPQRDRK